MTKWEAGGERPPIDPMLFALNAGEIMHQSQPVQETAEGLQVLLARMGCDLGKGAVGTRFDRITEHYKGAHLAPGGRAANALVKATTSALLTRDNTDVSPAEALGADEDFSSGTVVLLKGFMTTLAGGRQEAWIDRAVAGEIRYQRARFKGSTSYAAVRAVRYHDRVLDGLGLAGNVEKTLRAIRTMRTIRIFGGDIYA